MYNFSRIPQYTELVWRYMYAETHMHINSGVTENAVTGHNHSNTNNNYNDAFNRNPSAVTKRLHVSFGPIKKYILILTRVKALCLNDGKTASHLS